MNDQTLEGCAKLLVVLLIFIVVLPLIALIWTLPVMWLWNWLMPVIFKLPTITWVQAWGLCVLSSILIKSHNLDINRK